MGVVNSKYILPVILILILGLIIKNIGFSIFQLNHNSTRVTNLKSQFIQEKQQQQFLKERLYYVKTNEFVENEAREKLGMVKEGELIVLAPPTENKKIIVDTENKNPNWQKWWNLFF